MPGLAYYAGIYASIMWTGLYAQAVFPRPRKNGSVTLFCACARGRDARVLRWMDGRGETSRSTPAYSEPWMRRERINVSVHSIYAIVCRSPRQTKRLGLCCLSNFVVFQYFMPLPSYHSHTMLFTARGICLRTLRISSYNYIEHT